MTLKNQKKVVSAFRKMGKDVIHWMLSFTSRLSTLQSGRDHKPCKQNVFLRWQESERKEMSWQALSVLILQALDKFSLALV